MPRSALVVLVAGTLVVLGAAGAALAGDERDLAFVDGVAPLEAVGELAPGAVACQHAVAVIEPFAAIRLTVDTGGAPGPPLIVTVAQGHHDAHPAARVPDGYVSSITDPRTGPVARIGRVVRSGAVDVCVGNHGKRPVLIGGARQTQRGDGALTIGGRDVDGAMTLTFLRERPASLLAELPAAFRRAALFHPPFVGAWTFWLLAVLVAIGVPVLIGLAVRAACEPDRP